MQLPLQCTRKLIRLVFNLEYKLLKLKLNKKYRYYQIGTITLRQNELQEECKQLYKQRQIYDSKGTKRLT